MSTHIECFNAKVYRIGSCLEGSSQALARTHGSHYFVFRHGFNVLMWQYANVAMKQCHYKLSNKR